MAATKKVERAARKNKATEDSIQLQKIHFEGFDYWDSTGLARRVHLIVVSEPPGEKRKTCQGSISVSHGFASWRGRRLEGVVQVWFAPVTALRRPLCEPRMCESWPASGGYIRFLEVITYVDADDHVVKPRIRCCAREPIRVFRDSDTPDCSERLLHMVRSEGGR